MYPLYVSVTANTCVTVSNAPMSKHHCAYDICDSRNLIRFKCMPRLIFEGPQSPPQIPHYLIYIHIPLFSNAPLSLNSMHRVIRYPPSFLQLYKYIVLHFLTLESSEYQLELFSIIQKTYVNSSLVCWNICLPLFVSSQLFSISFISNLNVKVQIALIKF